MTDEVQQGIAAYGTMLTDGEVQLGGDPNAAPTLEDTEAPRNAENLERAKANGYVEPAEPSISERVAALVAGVQHAMDHNSPISREYFAEMKALLGYRETPGPAQSEA